MLSVRTRQSYMKKLGFYKGKVDGVEGPLTKAGYRALQETYFVREKDKDGIYGHDTDILLVNAYRVHKNTKNFDLKSDQMIKCQCGGKYCTGYPQKLNTQLLKIMQDVRDKYGAMTITSGLRCKKYNQSLPGSAKNSKHMDGKAVDFFVAKCTTENGRKNVMNFIKKQEGHNYTYCNLGGSHPNMGNCIHMEVK